jgi:hypothetical protein
LSLAKHDNDTAISQLAPFLHQLATQLPSNSKAGDVAAGLLLLFAHGLGQVAFPVSEEAQSQGDTFAPEETNNAIVVCKKPLVVFLGFAGGMPSTLKQYSSRIYPASEFDVVISPASEIPEIYNRSIDKIVNSIEASLTSWSIHLFSKAGFLLCARLMERILKLRSSHPNGDGAAPRLPPPKAVIWDSSPGSVTNYDEFVEGTWQSLELIPTKAQFEFSSEARARLNSILRSEAYPRSVETSYGPMHSLIPFPTLWNKIGDEQSVAEIEHLFLFSEKDAVCDPNQIRKYAHESVTRQTQVIVSGTHCDGLFWSRKIYVEAVRSVLLQKR